MTPNMMTFITTKHDIHDDDIDYVNNYDDINHNDIHDDDIRHDDISHTPARRYTCSQDRCPALTPTAPNTCE